MKISDLVREHIRGLSAYVPGKPVRQAERESGIRCIKMASNENPFGPSPLAIAAIRQAANSTNFYPDNDANDLRCALAERHSVEPEQILVTDGSTALIDIIARSFLAPGLNAITSERSFIVYKMVTRSVGGTLIEVPMRDDHFDLNAILAAITPETRIVYIANPNNPTGTMFFADALDRFVERVPQHVMIALDEAYSDYAEFHARKKSEVYSRSIEHVKQGRENVVVLRTFSKAHGLAGLRVGYGMGDPKMLRYFAQVRTAFSVSGIGEAAALAALRDEAHIRLSVERNAEGVAYLTPRLRELGFRVVPTTANFIYLETAENPSELGRRVQNEGCIIRSLVPWGIPNALRITVGTPEQNRTLIESLKRVLKGLQADLKQRVPSVISP
ncbi:MAG TPA: histidinol-phosphate transaminase [Terriglobales bacterium]|nr:histidinol-phosphate transaminase [Terriglobales bacterium]